MAKLKADDGICVKVRKRSGIQRVHLEEHPEVEFYSDILGEKVRRPFRFRTFAFIPSLDSKWDDENKVSFG